MIIATDLGADNSFNLYWNKLLKSEKLFHKGNCKKALDTLNSIIKQKQAPLKYPSYVYHDLYNVYLDELDNCKDIQHNYKLAVKYLAKYANATNSSYSNLAKIFYYGQLEQKKDINKALQYYLKAYNNTAPMWRKKYYDTYLLGKIYYDLKDYKNAFKYLYVSRENKFSKKLLNKLCKEQSIYCTNKPKEIKPLNQEVAIHYFNQGKLLKCGITTQSKATIINNTYHIRWYKNDGIFSRTIINGNNINKAETSANDCILYNENE